ncbi:unnamed protein product [Darwinula stevensoni]|uniref:CARD domain-containing protein n=1 Tax=Darwinula stevensoni TaxID=69355 RepID=A0A7R8XFS1_9CRUS|nr:unnamed protein product [Darwinula stevensoni]CAG0895641.1 unnamed protein product [Darwinula stevensoni]
MTTHGDAISAALDEHKNTFQQYTDLEEIFLCLKRKKIIENDEYHEMMKETSGRKKKQVLFLHEKIISAGDNAFIALLECLKARYKDLAEALLRTLEMEDEAFAKEVRNKWEGGSSTASQVTAAQPVGLSTTWDRIRENRMRLRDEFNLDFQELLRSLSDKGVFTLIEGQQIRGKPTPKQQFDELFDILICKNPQLYYPVFLKALTDIDRKDVRDFLEGGSFQIIARDLLHVSRATVPRTVNRFLKVILSLCQETVKFPDNLEEVKFKFKTIADLSGVKE